MQELTTSPQMASPYTPVGGSNTPPNMPQPPTLGPPIPGTTGGLAAKPGLSVFDNPLSQPLQSSNPSPQNTAQQLQGYGRGEDSMLVHMTPNEVNSLRGLAQRFGGDLSVNPHTGLPEAGWLGKLLPTILGGLGMLIPGVAPWMLAAGVGVGQTALTGDLSKGLMAGLQAFGGASLASGLGVGGAGKEVVADVATKQGANQLAAQSAPTAEAIMKSGDMTSLFGGAGGAGGVSGAGAVSQGVQQGLQQSTGSTGILDKLRAASRMGLPQGILSKAAPYAAGMGLMSTLSDATAPNLPKYNPQENKSPYTPMAPGRREVRYQTPQQMRESGGAEYNYFTPSNPAPRPVSSLTDEERDYYGYAEGGLAALPASENFEDIVKYFGSTSPGAITASMYPSSAQPATAAAPTPVPTAEKVHNFKRTPEANTPATTGMPANLAGMNFGGFGIPNIDLSNIAQQYANMGYPDMSSLPSPMTRNPQVAAYLASQGTAQPVQPVPTAPNMDDEESPMYYGKRAPYSYDDYNEFPMYYAKGGGIDMRDGAFVVDARTVSELGNGSSNAGIELLSRLGGQPVRGAGDGVSDSVPASIGGKQEARVARDEVIFQPDAVRRIGGGSEKRGTQKLYAMMDKAHKARKKAGRGQDTKLRRGLA